MTPIAPALRWPSNPDGLRPARSMAAAPAASVMLRAHNGEVVTLDTLRWHTPATAGERALLGAVAGPVIDLGCGPGRLVADLADRGVTALGIDVSPTAVALARRRGARVIEQSLFEPLPWEGRWATALVFDGNVGIGGDPVRLLTRCREVIAADGQILVEVEPPGARWHRLTAWFERDGQRSDPFAWAVVGADAIEEMATAAGLRLTAMTELATGRWFAHLRRADRVSLPADARPGTPEVRQPSPVRSVALELLVRRIRGDANSRKGAQHMSDDRPTRRPLAVGALVGLSGSSALGGG